MIRRTVRPLLAMVAVVLAAMGISTPTASGLADSGNSTAGPPYNFTTELMGQYKFIPLKDVAMLTRTKHGYLFRTGQQDSHLVITQVEGGLRFVDRGTKKFKKLSRACHRQRVRVGVAAVCRVPRTISVRRPMLVEVWPRLGNDFTDGSSLPATFALAVLGDEGVDNTLLGAGPDFFNGHSGRDRVSGGAGRDWIRAGLGNDPVWGGPGNDDLVGMQGNDVMFGGSGNDRLVGMDGRDRLRGDEGKDLLQCGGGWDRATSDYSDMRTRNCESVGRG